MDVCCFWTVVGDGDSPEHVFRAALGDFLEHVEVATSFEDPEIGEFKFWLRAAAGGVFTAEPCVGVFGLGILVECLGVGMSRGGIEVVVAFLDVLTVISLVSADTKKPFLQNGILSIPKGGCEAEAALAVGPAL